MAEKRHGNHEIRKEGDEEVVVAAFSRKWRRGTKEAFFDDARSSGNITLIEGQTAMMECIVRHVGNKSVC